ncbi:hypothetical protein SCT_1147 [Sulfuricella sp. T08]|uniref:hypothetical protein n=1 Tax=Sulfuricella sp. T08 TaxID=1632857 RepID=UPI0006179ABE|nr:hypothetical protein [Sulfuricella sp. T08]GAO35756.1 hypothetical protein SCT_1147 [Sulfuricella sp. T08]
MQKVNKVYYFTTYNIMTDETKRMPRPATLKAIAAAHGTAINETVQEVDVSRLDGYGYLIADKR